MSNWLITYQWSCSSSGYGKPRIENELIDVHPVEWLRNKEQTSLAARDKLYTMACESQGQEEDHYLEDIARTEYKLLWAMPVDDEVYGDGLFGKQT